MKFFKKIFTISGNTNINQNQAQKFIDGATKDYKNDESQNKQIEKQKATKQRGRPKVNTEDKIQVSLYLTKSQNEHINFVANGLGMSKSNYMLYMLFQKENFFSNDDIEELLRRARANGTGLKEYLRSELKLK